ncbi:MAG TPA: AtpZ/AtpI family protein [Candidatus Dormibacteraeota bacterium]|nr:AtpZ/AtpI family protein [Candidatus Dormibacteraeota bacterium]
MIEKSKINDKNEQNSNSSISLLNATLQMSWKLAIVVLVPLIGGVKLDERWKLFPYLTIIGSLLAIGGFIYVIWKTLADFNQSINSDKVK